MRTEIVQGDDFSVTVRGKIRRTGGYYADYLMALKQINPATQKLDMPDKVTTGTLDHNAMGWALLGDASTVAHLISRSARVLCVDGQEWIEPFKPEQLLFLFTHYLDSEELPDKSDFWSRVIAAIERMDEPPKPDPKASSDTESA